MFFPRYRICADYRTLLKSLFYLSSSSTEDFYFGIIINLKTFYYEKFKERLRAYTSRSEQHF